MALSVKLYRVVGKGSHCGGTRGWSSVRCFPRQHFFFVAALVPRIAQEVR